MVRRWSLGKKLFKKARTSNAAGRSLRNLFNFSTSTEYPPIESLEPRLLLSTMTVYDQADQSAYLSPVAQAAGLMVEDLYDQGIRAINWQGQLAYAEPGRWIVSLDQQAGRTLLSVLPDPLPTAQFAAGDISLLSLDAIGQTVSRGIIDEIITAKPLFDYSSLLLEISQSVSYEQLYDQLSSLQGFQYLEPDFTIFSNVTIPNDPSFNKLWGMVNLGQSGGTPGLDIDATDAWDISTGSGDFVIGVIDTGIDYNHPDLLDNIWTNPGEIADDGIDNDGNGYIDDYYGWNFRADDNDPFDDQGHGTHVAGTIAAVGNNSLGVTGVNWNAQVMALKFLSETGSGRVSDAVKAIRYATMMHRDYGINVRVTNNSWGSFVPSDELFDAISESRDAGQLFIAAAGNDARDNEVIPSFPASYNIDNIISVAATDDDDRFAVFTNFGSQSVDLAAPGVAIYSTVPTEGMLGDPSGYRYLQGTSMATPHVVGAAALMWDLDPSASYQKIKARLLATVDPLPDPTERALLVTGGRLNLNNAMQQIGLLVIDSIPAKNEISTTPPTQFVITLDDTVDLTTLQPTDFTVNGLPADSVTANLDQTILTFEFNQSPASAQGVQTMEIAANAFTRTSDSQPVAAWSAPFFYDQLPLVVTATAPTSDGSVVTLPLTNLLVDFNEPIDPASLDINDLFISKANQPGETAAMDLGAQVVDVRMIDSDTAEFDITGLDQQWTIVIGLAGGAVTDVYGNPIAPYIGEMILDVDSSPLPTPFNTRGPAGGLIYQSQQLGAIHNNDTDLYTLNLASDQTVTILLDPSKDFVAIVQLLSPSQTVLASAQSTSEGQSIILQTIDIDETGLYTIAVAGGDVDAVGSFEFQVVINAAAEYEAFIPGDNNSLANAQSLDDDFLNMGPTVDRAAVITSGAAYENFESGTLGDQWETYAAEDNARIQVSGEYGTAQGDFALLMDVNILRFREDNLNEAIWTVDLTDVENATLRFWHMDSDNDTEHLFDGPFVDHHNADGIAISSDGQNWFPLWDAVEQGVTQELDLHPWKRYTADIAAVAAAAGITLGDDFKIKFQQYDDFPLPTNGRGFDEIAVFDASEDWYAFNLEAEQSVSVALGKLAFGQGSIELYDASGQLLTIGQTDVQNLDSLISQFVATATGRYFVRVFAYEADYALVVTRNAAFNAEPDNRIDQARDITTSSAALGGLAFDDYKQTLTQFEVGDLQTLTYEFTGAFSPNSSALLTFDAIADLSNVNEFLTVSVEGINLGDIFVHGGVDLLPSIPHQITIDQSQLTSLVSDGIVTIHVTPSESVDASQLSELTITLEYQTTHPDTDYYKVAVAAGDTLHIQAIAPGGNVNQPMNNLDPAIELYDPSGQLIAANDNASPQTLDSIVDHTALTAGYYTIRVIATDEMFGQYLLTVDGHTGQLDSLYVVEQSPGELETVIDTTDEYSVTFNQPIRVDSLDPSFLTVNGRPATAVEMLDAQTAVFTLPIFPGETIRIVKIEQGLVLSIQGQANESFEGNYIADSTPPRIIFSSVRESDTIIAGQAIYGFSFIFNEPLRQNQLDENDFSLTGMHSGLHEPDQWSYDTNTSMLTILYDDLQEDIYRLTLFSGDDQFEDIVGHDLDGESIPTTTIPTGDGQPGGNFVVNFNLDMPPSQFNTPLDFIQPDTSPIYRGSMAGAIGFIGDTDTFTIDLRAGQLLTILASGDLSLQPAITITGPALNLSADSPSPGTHALLQNIHITQDATYTLTVSSVDHNTTGTYGLTIFVNATVENETYIPTDNNTPQQAQNIDNSFILLDGSASHAAVIGQTASYRDAQSQIGNLFHPNVLTFTFENSPAPLGDGTLAITAFVNLDPANRFLSIDIEGIISRDIFVDPQTTDDSPNYIEITLTQQQLQLLLADSEINVTITPSDAVVENFQNSMTVELSYPAASSLDYFAFTAEQNQTLSLIASRISGQNVQLQLLANDGSLLAYSISIDDGGNQVINDYLITQTGQYLARVLGDGEYSLVINKNISIKQPFYDPTGTLATDITTTGRALGYAGYAPFINHESESNDNTTPGGSLQDLNFANDLSGSFQSLGENEYQATVTGIVEQGNDLDWDFYRVYASPGDSITVSMNGDSLVDPFVRIYDNAGNEIAYNDDIELGVIRDSLLEFDEFTYAGDYYIVAESWGPELGSYNLTVTLTTDDFSLGNRNDSYTIDLLAGDILIASTQTLESIGLAFEPNLDLAISIYDPSGELLANSDHYGDVLAVIRATDDGTYTIKVSALSNIGGQYILDTRIEQRLPGDADGDGLVGLVDLDILGRNFSTLAGATWQMGDFDGDGAVLLQDLNILGQFFYVTIS